MKVRNRLQLLSHGVVSSRKIVLDVVEETLKNLDSYKRVKDLAFRDGRILRVGEESWDLEKKRKVYLIGAGKAANGLARAVEEIISERLEHGLVIVKSTEENDRLLKRTELVEAGHPIPNEAGYQASLRILEMVEQAEPDDLFICVITGGSSALMNCPVEGISLEDEATITEMLLRSGAKILEINAVRRHISRTNGGRLAQKIENKGAELINIFVMDGVGDRPTLAPWSKANPFGTPVAPDRTTYQDAWKVLYKYRLLEKAPRTIIDFLSKTGSELETPKSLGKKVHHFVIAGVADSVQVAADAAGKLGIHSLILTTQLEGESREAGFFLASVAREIAFNGRPLRPPCFLLASGETTTRIESHCGLGGPSQELAIAFGLEAYRIPDVCLVAMDTDGTDGPTKVAGGIVDSETVKRSMEKNVDLHAELEKHNSLSALESINDAVITGNTGTNVCDLNLVYIPNELK